MISLKNNKLQKKTSLKLCKTHKIRRARICRNGKIKLNMTKIDVSRNFRKPLKRLPVVDAQKVTTMKKIDNHRG